MLKMALENNQFVYGKT